MNVLMEAMNGLGAVLLQVAAALALEELTFGGLVRLMMAPRPGAGRCGACGDDVSPDCKRSEPINPKGERTCSH